MDYTDGGYRLHEAIKAALETAAQAGRLEGSMRQALEATLATLDGKLPTESSGLSYSIMPAPDHCLVIVHPADPVAGDIVASFLHTAGATKLGTAKVWLLPLGDVPVNRWIRGLKRVVSAERKTHPETEAALPVRLTVVWPKNNALVVANVG